MKETLDEQSRISLTRYRMDRADEAIEEAALKESRGTGQLIQLLSVNQRQQSHPFA